MQRVYCGKTADWIWLPFGVVRAVSQGMGVLVAGEVVGGERYFWGKRGASHCNKWELCGIVILSPERWRRGYSQITLVFLVIRVGDML